MSRPEDERGFTVVELMATMAVMGVIVAATLGVAYRALTDTGIVQNRRDVLGDGQLALTQLTKQLRQAESVNQLTSTTSLVEFNGYINGTAHKIAWRALGSAAPYQLQTRRDDGAWWTVAKSLASADVFTYTTHDTVLDQVTIQLSLGTKTSTVTITSDVNMRNA